MKKIMKRNYIDIMELANPLVDNYLTDKQVILNNPGEKRNDLYYTKNETSVSMVEATFWNGRFKQDLTSHNFGGSGSVNIPNQSFVGSAFLQVEVPAIVANQTIIRGWLFALIDRIDYVFGSASVGNISLDGQSVFQINMLQCETAEKRSQVMKLAGEEQLVATADTQFAACLIPLPFSSICGLYPKKPFDTSLLASPIQINIYFNPASTIYGGTGARPASLSAARILLRQGQLTFQNQSLRHVLRSQPSGWAYPYPIIHKQSFITQTSAGLGLSRSIQLEQFIYADLLGIVLGIVRTSDVSSGDDNTNSPFNYIDVKDFRCLYNGNVIYDAPSNIHQLFQINNNLGATYYENSVVGLGTVNPFNSVPVNNDMVVIDLSRTRQLCFEDSPDGFENTFRIAHQTLTCTFTVPDDSSFSVYCTYLYNGIVESRGDGTTLIYYN